MGYRTELLRFRMPNLSCKLYSFFDHCRLTNQAPNVTNPLFTLPRICIASILVTTSVKSWLDMFTLAAGVDPEILKGGRQSINAIVLS